MLRFPSVFWDDAVDYFGAAPAGGPAARGRCSTFWNLHRWGGQPILAGLLSGLSADQVHLPWLLIQKVQGSHCTSTCSAMQTALQPGCQRAHTLNQA